MAGEESTAPKRVQDAITHPSRVDMPLDQLAALIKQRVMERDALTAEIHALEMLHNGRVMDQPEVRPE